MVIQEGNECDAVISDSPKLNKGESHSQLSEPLSHTLVVWTFQLHSVSKLCCSCLVLLMVTRSVHIGGSCICEWRQCLLVHYLMTQLNWFSEGTPLAWLPKAEKFCQGSPTAVVPCFFSLRKKWLYLLGTFAYSSTYSANRKKKLKINN